MSQLTSLHLVENKYLLQGNIRRLNLFFQSFSKTADNYNNMLLHISKEINGNFNPEYKRLTTSHRRSNRNLQLDSQSIISAKNNDEDSTELVDTTNTTKCCNNLILSNSIRCYLEDFMIRNAGDRLLVLLPSHYCTMTATKWNPLSDSDIRSTEVLFTQARYSGYIGVVCTNPLIGNVPSGTYPITIWDLEHIIMVAPFFKTEYFF